MRLHQLFLLHGLLFLIYQVNHTVLKAIYTRESKALTLCLETKLSADNSRSSGIPAFVTHFHPQPLQANLHLALQIVPTSNQPNISVIANWNCRYIHSNKNCVIRLTFSYICM